MTDIKAEINLIKMANDIACIKQAVMGNGEPGLCQRVDNLEQAERKIGKLVGFSAGIGVCCGSVFTYIFNLLKGG